ncbi:MAG TPA: alpha/beta hydrolase [Acidimicrobiia bacterium]|nr:alpha/beta hydrolase [Acidimicrobiia bacterium]
MDIDVRDRMDPEIAAVMGEFRMPAVDTAEQLAAMVRQLPRVVDDSPPPEGVEREERAIPGERGDPDVAIRIFRPTVAPPAPVPAYLWIHGGGYVAGSHDQNQAPLDALVADLGCVAVSVEYRLAPETPYPGPLDDCWSALSYMVDNASDLGIDPARVAIGGASAGGGLAAALALLARDRGVPLTHQHLIYPMIDDRQVTASSQWIVPVWNRDVNRCGWMAYLGDLYGHDHVPAYAAPARAEDLAGLPPAYVHVGTLDGFLHEDVEYAARLLAAGVPTELHVFPGCPHGFDSLAGASSLAREANEIAARALAKVLTP